MDEIEKLRADLVLTGWRIERNSLNDRMNIADWYAWHPKRPGAAQVEATVQIEKRLK